MKKYKTSSWDTKITEIEIVRETPAFVTYVENYWGKSQERRQKKDGREKFHDTWELAHAYLLAKAEESVKAARRNLELANSEYGNVKGMKRP
jgi:hypothetical protein